VVQAAVISLVGVLSACGLSNGIDEYVVHFAPGTPEAPARAVGEACPKFGKAFLEPKDKNNLATSRAYPVRYNITDATTADKNALLDCLKKHSIVRGVSDTNDDT
jgi:hypothetical protein